MTQSLYSDSTKVRYAERAAYDRDSVFAILDASYVAHVGIVADDGRPVVIPMLYARDGESLVVHGAPATRLVRTLKAGVDVCLTVTLVDGLVLARSAFHHSVNYRSAVVLGRAAPIDDLDERIAALDLLVDRVAPGRREGLRPMTSPEVRRTAVLRVPIEEASAKVRSGPPVDDEEDYGLPIWAGVLPIAATYADPVPDPRNLQGLPTPADVTSMIGRRTDVPVAD